MNNKDLILPDDVRDNIRFLDEKCVWHILSKNAKVVGCGDAAAKRNRLGNKGIPIFDELKSELGFFINKEHQQQNVLVHCRGNQKLDRLKISGILNSEYQRTYCTENSKGLINPFGLQNRNLLQIFDISTTKHFCPPYTMMTNAGDFEYAVEFEVNSLICALKSVSDENILVENVIRVDNYNSYKRHKIGILTGNGPDSGMLLWKKINNTIKNELEGRLKHSFTGDLSYPEILVSSVPDMGISMELDKRFDATENAVVKSVMDLCQSGITLLCIACNTTQYYRSKIEKICNLYDVRFISIPDVVNDYLSENHIKEFDFVGISHVVDFENLSSFKELNTRYKMSHLNESVLKKIEDIAFIAKNDINRAANLLRDLIQIHTKYDTVIVALTEISTILSAHKKLLKILGKNKIVVDSLGLLAEEVAKTYVNGIFDTLFVDRNKESIKIELLNADEKVKVKSEIWNILCEINYEFTPPLSSRYSTTTAFSSEVIELAESVEDDKPKAYFDTFIKQEIIVSKKESNNRITGFMSYIPFHKIHINEKDIICHYITTIGVTKGERGNGITGLFYKRIEEIAKKDGANIITTRTWNTNQTHIKIASDFGYERHVIKNDRGPGIDTVYLIKDITK